MKKTTKLLSPEAFEAVCNSWEQRMKEFILQLSDGSIPTLRDVEWTIKKGVFSSVSQILYIPEPYCGRDGMEEIQTVCKRAWLKPHRKSS